MIDLAAARQQVAIDVGANIGNHAIFLAELFRKVIAFEPNPLARSLLQINVELNNAANVEIMPVGLSDSSGKVSLEFEHSNLGAATAISGHAGSECSTAMIDLAVGDNVIEKSVPVGFIKVDVEGAEDSVLRGLEETIRSHKPILMIEQWQGVIDANDGTSPCLLFLKGLGYSAWDLVPSPPFRGGLGKLMSLLLGKTEYRLEPVYKLQKRDYRALFFLPD